MKTNNLNVLFYRFFFFLFIFIFINFRYNQSFIFVSFNIYFAKLTKKKMKIHLKESDGEKSDQDLIVDVPNELVSLFIFLYFFGFLFFWFLSLVGFTRTNRFIKPHT